MKLQALHKMRGDYVIDGELRGTVQRGQQFSTVSAEAGRSLVARGVAVIVDPGVPRPRMKGNRAASGPLDGSPIGEEKPPSSSPAAPARKGKTLRRRGDAPKS